MTNREREELIKSVLYDLRVILEDDDRTEFTQEDILEIIDDYARKVL